MAEENEVTANKLAKENQVTKEPQQVTTNDPNKVKAGKRLAEYNHKKREELKAQKSEGPSGVSQYYGIGVILAVGVIGSLGYYLYKAKEGEVPPQQQAVRPPRPQNNKFEMD